MMADDCRDVICYWELAHQLHSGAADEDQGVRRGDYRKPVQTCMFLLQLSVFAIAAFAPGFALVRRLRWSPLEKLCGSIGFSMLLLYVVAWGTFCFSPREEAGDGCVDGGPTLDGSRGDRAGSAIPPRYCGSSTCSKGAARTGRLRFPAAVDAGDLGDDPPLLGPWLGSRLARPLPPLAIHPAPLSSWQLPYWATTAFLRAHR